MPLNTKTITIALATAVANGIAASQSGTAGTPLTLNGSLVTGGVATLDSGGAARRVIITPAGDEHTNSFTITGTDRYGRPQIETIAGVANPAVVQSTKDFLTVSKIVPVSSTAAAVTAGTNGVASSDAYICDWVPNGNLIGAALEFSGTANATVQECLDDFAPSWDQVANNFVWYNDAGMTSISANTRNNLAGPFTAIRLTVNSYSNGASVTLKLITPFIGGRI